MSHGCGACTRRECSRRRFSSPFAAFAVASRARVRVARSPLPLGASCTSDRECASGWCEVSGFTCVAYCDGVYQRARIIGRETQLTGASGLSPRHARSSAPRRFSTPSCICCLCVRAHTSTCRRLACGPGTSLSSGARGWSRTRLAGCRDRRSVMLLTKTVSMSDQINGPREGHETIRGTLRGYLRGAKEPPT